MGMETALRLGARVKHEARVEEEMAASKAATAAARKNASHKPRPPASAADKDKRAAKRRLMKQLQVSQPIPPPKTHINTIVGALAPKTPFTLVPPPPVRASAPPAAC